jgi:glycosyltransferase involved in cell wall biosynthesis
MTSHPTVTVAVPVFNEEGHLAACLDAIAAQTYGEIIEVLVIDGRSTDRTREIALGYQHVTLLDNPRRIQAAALNVALRYASGEVFVRVDGHCTIAPDYVERCVEALTESGAAMVGGGMSPVASGTLQEGISAAMASRLGAGPARFHVGGAAAWVDTVYLGAFRTALAREVGGYAEDVGVNEDSEFAIRMAPRGGIWFDPSICSTYVPRDSIGAVAKQFHKYGRSRAATLRRHPRSLKPRQLVTPMLVLALLSPWRGKVTVAYAAVVVARAARERGRGPAFAATLPVMHLAWGTGFWRGLVSSPPHPPATTLDGS